MTWLTDVLWVLYDLCQIGLMFAARNEYTKLKGRKNSAGEWKRGKFGNVVHKG